jgi:uncharacterized membrane protein YeaQ/YmgE (transglycosylase-associated protein family)
MHSTSEGVVAWAAIGFCAALIAMAWPTRRGKSIAANLVTGIVGAVVIALVGYELNWTRGPFSNASFSLAAAGAVASLFVMHAVWGRALAARSR